MYTPRNGSQKFFTKIGSPHIHQLAKRSYITTMRPTPTLLALRVKVPKPELTRYTFQDLSSVSHRDLPNNGFGVKNYYISKTKFHHWPVYKKVQNTKITTEIKRIQGDLHQLKQDLLEAYPQFDITMNQGAGIVNIKGDVTREVTELFEKEIKI